MLKTIGKILAVLAGLALIISSFAFSAGAAEVDNRPPDAESHAAPLMPHFYRDLTVGSTGADVIALQNWLIGRGFAIPAGATGYFGEQTKGALARYQASESIYPAVGYFGPITRARVLSVTQGPASVPPSSGDDTDDKDNDDQDDDSVSKADVRDAINDAEDMLADVRDEIEDADDDGADVDEAEDLSDEAQDRIIDAEDALVYGDYDDAIDFLNEAEDLLDDARDSIEDQNNDDEDEDDSDKVSISAEVTRVSGADNDYATFEVEVELSAFGEDIYIDQDEEVSFDYEVLDEDGNEVTGSTLLSANLESTADEEGDYYVVEEDESERFTLTVVFDPLATDEGQLFRLQLSGINYADAEQAPEDTWNARPAGDYRTKSVLIAD